MNLASVPTFDPARRLSLTVYFVLSTGLWIAVIGTLVFVAALLFFHIQMPPFAHAPLQGPLAVSQRLALAGDLVFYSAPSMIILFSLRTLFLRFARGEVFTADNIERIRSVGLWLLVSAVANGLAQYMLFRILEVTEPDYDFKPLPLLYGAITYVVAYVMAEARRIADDNASIV